MTLRTRLLLGLLGLVSVGLVVSNLVTYRALQTFLYGRLDGQLESAQSPLLVQLTDGERDGGFGRHGPGSSSRIPATIAPIGTYAALVGPEGDIRVSVTYGYQQSTEPLPRPLITPEDLDSGKAVTVKGTDDSGPFRLLAAATTEGDTLVVAMPMNDLEQTLSRLVWIEVLATVGVLAAVGLFARWLVRQGLRPLEDIAHTAGAIAAGDLSRRVEPAEPKTEVGQLGLALNAMLGQIEGAFSSQQASENRLRRFVADASHELRTPLTSIRGYAELFRRGASERPEDLAKAMRRIEEEAARMGVLVDDLLLLARLDQRRPLEREPVDLTRLTTDAVDDFRAVDPHRRISLDATMPARVEGDDARLRQVVGNLLANARQHTPAGTPVHVLVAVDDEHAVVEVADEGPGLTEEQAARVFERFYRADASRTRDHGGTGLGLAIVAAIAEAHGGAVSVDTALGRGTRFRVELPLASGNGRAPVEFEPPKDGWDDDDDGEADSPDPSQPSPSAPGTRTLGWARIAGVVVAGLCLGFLIVAVLM